jgi:hypothetical protein
MLVMNDFVAASFEFDQRDGVLRVTLEGQLTDTRKDCGKPSHTLRRYHESLRGAGKRSGGRVRRLTGRRPIGGYPSFTESDSQSI